LRSLRVSETEKAACWDRIASEWTQYCKEGANAFDWDYDSRVTMTELTGERAFQWANH
jgi:hypothetical protein